MSKLWIDLDTGNIGGIAKAKHIKQFGLIDASLMED